MFDMTNDSHLFRTREELEEEGFALEGNVFVKGEERWLPLHEGKFGFQYNHHYSTIQNNDIIEVEKETLKDPNFVILPQFWVTEFEAIERLTRNTTQCQTGLLGFRRISCNTNERTIVATIIPWGAASYGWILSLGPNAKKLLLLLSIMDSYIFDYITRNSLSQPSIPQGTVKQLACLNQSKIPLKNTSKILNSSLELTLTAYDLQTFAQDCGYDGPPFKWDEERRFLILCELDAAYFHLYGIERDDVNYIMETFPIVKRKDEKKYGSYRTKEKILDIYDMMAEAIRTGQEYQTIVDPPPGPPIDADGKFVPVEEWDERHWPRHVHRMREL